MEYEVRYYYPKNEYENILNKLSAIKELTNNGRKYEKTSQFNHCYKKYNFYSKEIDGRFRVRITKDENESKCKLSWKRRLKDTFSDEINKEEIELNILPNEYDNLLFIINNVLHMEEIETYERYRTTFSNKEVEIAVDEYPFGLAIEIEAQKDIDNSEQVIKKYINILNLDKNRKYRLSWDDKYEELCKEQKIPQSKQVIFGKVMPQVK